MPLHELLLTLWPVQVESQLDLAKGLSNSLNNRLFLKREDLQPVHSLITALLILFL